MSSDIGGIAQEHFLKKGSPPCIREFNGTDGEGGLHFGETAQVSTVSPNTTDRVWSCLVEKEDGTCIIVPDHYLVEIDDSSNEWVKPKQLFVALNIAKATQYNHLNVHTGRVYRYHYSESSKPNMWFMEDVTASNSSQKKVWGWINSDSVLLARHKSATAVNYPVVARQYLARLQNTGSMTSSSEAVAKYRELAFDRLCIVVAAYSPTEREASGIEIAEHDYVYVKDCLWDIAGCGFAYGHKEGCLEEGWMPTRCLVNVEMLRVATGGGGKAWEYVITYEEDRWTDRRTKKIAPIGDRMWVVGPSRDQSLEGLKPFESVVGHYSMELEELPLNDPKISFRWKSTGEVLRGWLVLKLCTCNYVIRNAEALYARSRSILGDGITHGVLRRTLFAHFCAGENEVDIKPKLVRLQEAGVTVILDPVDEGEVSHVVASSSGTAGPTVLGRHEEGRRFDSRVDLLKAAISTVNSAVEGKGIVAMKISPMGPPVVLERVSNRIRELESLYASRCGGSDCALSYEEVKEGWVEMHGDVEEEEMRMRFDKLDDDGDGKVDPIEWINSFSVMELSEMNVHRRDDEVALLQSMYDRVDAACKAAYEGGVRILIDAEWTAIQPAIDRMAACMMRKYNGDDTKGAIVYNTYQTYLKNTRRRVHRDLRMAQREGYKLGCKVVRGAYIVSERALAEKEGRESPIHDTYEATTASYHSSIEDLLKHASRPSMIIASHNAGTVRYAVQTLEECGNSEERQKHVYFGQLLGMSDPITFVLADNGYKAYKYVPYGPVKDVVPYLIRRTQENSTLLGTPAVAEERKMLFTELRRRLFGRRVAPKISAP
ncbi:proline oxidase, putative [Perkinsus marinus ATCC 50983]|uniref:proline dehydrogenase n=1 Tax=Perkinsus marinus (strain ATCC 50983 / TXsc) TaxID=423536 RepID=C5KAY3_PERM5|nr:proline oxidase, putative [Perkinsus marinus ATCC 50983]EER18309.1 proline oxidase, putative [Perkinsus marinus ATCC 50983]|eukprot:XP_002786513.1 proline oxidase, putative [Perkinsus marinus ATCC 50983]